MAIKNLNKAEAKERIDKFKKAESPNNVSSLTNIDLSKQNQEIFKKFLKPN